MVIRSEEAKPPKPSSVDNMTRARAERIGLKVGAKVRQYISNSNTEEKGSKCTIREGTVLEVCNHGFLTQLPTHRTFFRYNLLRGREMGERVEILKGRSREQMK
ncbi:hypothetical protein [Anaerotignum sp. MB30-C6]|uniref:hypothetical protein n=1 Tax=Anaerotignum sp. MB30-C6 TaxID=3070814 RepID=UPI0027DB6F71|nr:hypothetical protein [Anaerotignum sp. MB30-C6]WMI81572.1 hypothetical protein RBQ60_02215 [Anaerotignum sp. MB30-C6]